MNGAVKRDYAPSFCSTEHSTFAKKNCFNLRIINHDDFDDFSVGSDLICRMGGLRAERGQFAHRLRAQIVHHQIESSLRDIDSHWLADIAQTDESYACRHRWLFLTLKRSRDGS